jgi:hypothetical protein
MLDSRTEEADEPFSPALADAYLPSFHAANQDRRSPSGPSDAADWQPVLSRIGINAEQAEALEARALANGVPFQKELLTAGIVAEERIFRALAQELGLRFMERPDPRTLVTSEESCIKLLGLPDGIPVARILQGDGAAPVLIAPTRLDLNAMREFIRKWPGVAERLCIVTPSALRAAFIQRARPALTRIARDGLSEALPEFSARIVATAWQGAALGAFVAALPFCLSLAQSATQIVAHCVSSIFFLSCVALRLAVSGSGAGPLRPPTLEAPAPSEMPVYTVLVTLYREAAIVPDLMVALGRIAWPRSKLEIKLVCEADDAETLAAIRAQKLRPWVEVIEVPPEGPRTKPKALAYALPLCGGDFVVLYDAEDKPHPLQLIEAWQRFRQAGDDFACLQAPLSVSNRHEGMLAGLFGLEYAALFRGILPWLARSGALIPLGGTSNHFRRSALDNVGAWDPYNVTEDADLGLRLKRFGYRIGTLSYPTYEDAPDRLGIWIPQRTRWFKGWARLLMRNLHAVQMLGSSYLKTRSRAGIATP